MAAGPVADLGEAGGKRPPERVCVSEEARASPSVPCFSAQANGCSSKAWAQGRNPCIYVNVCFFPLLACVIFLGKTSVFFGTVLERVAFSDETAARFLSPRDAAEAL